MTLHSQHVTSMASRLPDLPPAVYSTNLVPGRDHAPSLVLSFITRSLQLSDPTATSTACHAVDKVVGGRALLVAKVAADRPAGGQVGCGDD